MNEHPPLFIAIEGIDGVGKTTVGRALAKHMRAHGRPAEAWGVPLQPFRRLKRYVATDCDLNTQFLFHLTGVADASRVINTTLSSHTVICARYIHSTLAYHRALGATLQIDPGSLGIRWPDIVFYLTAADEHVRRARIARRGERDATDRLAFEKGSLPERIDAEYRRFTSLTTIETSRLTVREVIAKIMLQLRR
ncbi:MAG: hypothetical protein WEG36_11010 [Gemmatimonadota bacterium]